MLTIKVPISPEGWDDVKQEFIEPKIQTLQLEHSLVSLSKWESKWKIPFYSKKEMTPEETLDYIRCMTLTKNVDPDVYNHLTRENIEEVMAYIGDPMTATTFGKEDNRVNNREVITSELIYYWMIASNIPFECQKWHLNRLITLIRVCGIKNTPPKKRSKRDIMNRNAALNAARRKQLNTKG
jgi:hypothetical protein